MKQTIENVTFLWEAYLAGFMQSCQMFNGDQLEGLECEESKRAQIQSLKGFFMRQLLEEGEK